MAPLRRASRLLRSAVCRLRSPAPARAFSSAAATETGAVIAAAAVAVASSGLGLWLKPPSLADSGEAPGGQISVTCAASTEAQEEKGRFLFAGERPPFSRLLLLMRYHSFSVFPEGFDGLARSVFCCRRAAVTVAAAVV